MKFLGHFLGRRTVLAARTAAAHQFPAHAGANAAIGILDGLRFRLKLEGGAELQSVLARGCMQGWGLMGSNAARFGHGNDQQRIHAGTRAEAVVPAREIAERVGAKLRQAIADFFS